MTRSPTSRLQRRRVRLTPVDGVSIWAVAPHSYCADTRHYTESSLSSTFSHLGVPDRLVARLAGLGIATPYPVQSATLADSLGGADVLVQSPTGSGKTLAFAIPLVARIGHATGHATRGLVLAPTRELAAQITAAVRPLAQASHLRVAAFYGGTGYKGDLDALRRGVDIVVGCPGRLIDLSERGALDLAAVNVVVIDEADRMADMGFLPAVRRLLERTSRDRQTMLFSATLTKAVERLVSDAQDRPRRHLLERPTDELGSRTHEFWRTAREERARLTAELVAGHASSIVFCRTKRGAERLCRQLGQTGLRAVAIHGDRSQAQRDRALERFRSGSVDVLVGTDVASRGLHIEGVDCVVHYDPPEDADTYVHRSGRTGRSGSSGRVVSLVCPDQERSARQLAQSLGLEASLGARLGPEERPLRRDRVGGQGKGMPRAVRRDSGASVVATSARSGRRRRGRAASTRNSAQRSPGTGRFSRAS